MLKRRSDLPIEKSTALHAAYIDPAYQCPTPYLENGLPYRLEPKPRGNRARLERAGVEVEEIEGVLHARVPLGTHGADHLGMDPESGRIGCILCDGGVS